MPYVDSSYPYSSIICNTMSHNRAFQRLLHRLYEGKELWAQSLAIYTAAVLTYGYTNSQVEGIHTNVQIAIMTVITLIGASPLSSTHLITGSIGVFAGGHNIIGSVGLIDDAVGVLCMNYIWLLLLTLVAAVVWRFGMVKYKVLDGYAGRLGTTVFVGMNLTMLIYGPLGVVRWDRYYYGLTEVLNSAEDSIPLSQAWIKEAELAVVYVVSVLFLGVAAGGTRVAHDKYIKRQEEVDDDPLSKVLPQALNNILVAVLWALLCMLVVNISGYKCAPVMFNGFAVGSYVAMASLQKIPSSARFAMISLVAAGWGLVLTPFFVGFPGSECFYFIFIQSIFVFKILTMYSCFKTRIWIHCNAGPCHLQCLRQCATIVQS